MKEQEVEGRKEEEAGEEEGKSLIISLRKGICLRVDAWGETGTTFWLYGFFFFFQFHIQKKESSPKFNLILQTLTGGLVCIRNSSRSWE